MVRTEKWELERFHPDDIKHLIITYSIGLIKNKGVRIKESVKIAPNDIEIAKGHVIISFMLEGLRDPNESEIIIHTMTIFLKNGAKIRLKLEKNRQFKHISSDSIELALKEKPTILKATERPRINKGEGKKEVKNIEKEDSEHFMNSYEKFKAKIQGTDLIDLIRTKTNNLDFSMKNFGISLLCTLLLLVKYVNELVDNNFQHDLQEFLKVNILESIKPEEVMT